LKALREVRKNRREQIGQMNLSSADIERSGKLVFEASGLCFSREGKNIIQSFSALVANGDKIGLVGPNGCGKTTLLKLLLEQLKPDSGTLKLGSKLKVAYFDQMRTGFAEEKSAIDNVGQGSQTVNIFGEEKHVIGYLQQFLFSPDRARSPVKYLSGGEKNRLYLASLFTKNANLLVLDEPTNDLDIESLEVLEAFLVDYPGTVLIVSHDRVFLENVVTTSWVYQGKGQFKEEVGAVHQYVHNEKPIDLLTGPKEKKAKELHESKPSNSLSQEDRKNLNRVTKKIDKLEAHIDELKIQLAEPSLYQAENNQDYLSLSKTLEEAEMALEALYEEWEALESKQ
jgi:ATP-binding cassette subfamily F protein uup